MDEREAYIALNMMAQVGPVGVRTLISALGTARSIFEADPDALRRVPGVGRKRMDALIEQRGVIDWAGESARAEELGAAIVTQIDAAYPGRLLNIYDPPLALYVRGDLLTRDEHAIAVVGTRRASHYGRESAGKLAYQLAQAGYTIVSGLAEGIDTAAHEAALSAKGRTIAVIGSGLDCLYPASNKKLADAIAGSGAVVSEFPLGKRPDRTTFPMRNRVVSGLSQGVLVVEAGLKSGALITADLALEQGRTVMAVPGRIDSYTSQGSHRLLRDGARLVTDVDDVFAEFEGLLPTGHDVRPVEKQTALSFSDDERTLIDVLIREGDVPADVLIRASGLKPGGVSCLLLGLEMKKAVQLLPGGLVKLTGRGLSGVGAAAAS